MIVRPPPGVRRPDSARIARMLGAHEHETIAKALAATLPTSTDLSRLPPTNQGFSESCTAHALVKGIEIITGGFLGSEHVLYSMTGLLEGDSGDVGRACMDTMQVARTSGICPFEGMSPDGRNSDVWTDQDTAAVPPNVTTPATADEIAGAARHVIPLGEHTILPSAPNRSDLVVASLAAGCPIYLGTVVGQNFFNDGGGMVIGPDPENDPQAGGHALLIVGHRTNPNGVRNFKVENSWGELWDDAGECWASEEWVAACYELHPLVLGTSVPPTMLPSWLAGLVAKIRAIV